MRLDSQSACYLARRFLIVAKVTSVRVMEDFETVHPPLTSVQRVPSAGDSTKIHRHATKVFKRILHSPNECDQALKQRISMAMRVLNQTQSTETAILQPNPTDGLRRLAMRVIKRMSIRN